MSFVVVEVDNPFAQTTTKEEESGAVSLDVNIRSGGDAIDYGSGRLIHYEVDDTTQTLSCSDTAWTLFYTYTKSPAEVWFQELTLSFNNDHWFKIEIDSEEIMSWLLTDYNDFIDGLALDYITIDSTGKKIRVNLDGSKGSEIKIYQKRRLAGTGNLTMYGYAIAYKETKS